MKKWSILLLVNFFMVAAFAQSYEGSIEYQKKDERAVIIEFPYSPSMVEDAIADKIDKMGFKKKESHGFILYKEAVLPEISSEPADYLIKVEKKSKKDKDESLVYLLIYHNEENILARNDALITSNAKLYLNRIMPDVDSYVLEQQIKEQEDAVTKAEKKLRGLQDDQGGLEKKLRKLQEDLKGNQSDQQSQQKEIEAQKKLLDTLKGKRKAA